MAAAIRSDRSWSNAANLGEHATQKEVSGIVTQVVMSKLCLQ